MANVQTSRKQAAGGKLLAFSLLHYNGLFVYCQFVSLLHGCLLVANVCLFVRNVQMFIFCCIVRCVAKVQTNGQTGSCSLTLAPSGSKNFAHNFAMNLQKLSKYFAHNSHSILRTNNECWSPQMCSKCAHLYAAGMTAKRIGANKCIFVHNYQKAPIIMHSLSNWPIEGGCRICIADRAQPSRIG